MTIKEAIKIDIDKLFHSERYAYKLTSDRAVIAIDRYGKEKEWFIRDCDLWKDINKAIKKSVKKLSHSMEEK